MTKLLPYSAVKPEAWPAEFRRLLDLRDVQVGPLETPCVAAGWRPTTFNFRVWDIGYFTGWLAWTKRLREGADLREYSTSDIMGAYVDDMRGFGLSTRTIANRVDGVRAALAALSPEYQTDWIMHGIKQLRREPSDRRRTSQRSQHTAELGSLGMDLMNGACRPLSNQSQLKKAILYRDGLMIVFLALAVPRLSPLQTMTLGQHLVAHGNVFQIRWSAKEMKEDKAYEALLENELSYLFQKYIDDFRPTLLARGGDGSAKGLAAVWLARNGGKLSRCAIYNMIRKRTKDEFGDSVFPHAFRHSAATSLALTRPDLIHLLTPLLQHQTETSRETYVFADKVAASRKYGDTLNGRRFRRGRRRPAPSADHRI